MTTERISLDLISDGLLLEMLRESELHTYLVRNRVTSLDRSEAITSRHFLTGGLIAQEAWQRGLMSAPKRDDPELSRARSVTVRDPDTFSDEAWTEAEAIVDEFAYAVTTLDGPTEVANGRLVFPLEATNEFAVQKRGELLDYIERVRTDTLREIERWANKEAHRMQVAADDPGSHDRPRKIGQAQGLRHLKMHMADILGGTSDENA